MTWLLSVVHGPDGCVSKHHVLSDPFVRLDRQKHAQPTIQLDDNAVSTGTVRIELDDEGYYRIIDDGSRNGIRINGIHVDEARLEPQDVIRVGDSLIVIDRTDPSRRGARTRSDNELIDSLCMFESTARFVFEGEVHYFDDDFESVAIVADGFTESRQIAAWLAARWQVEILRLDAAAVGARSTIRNAGSDVAVLIERVDSVSHHDLSELADAIEERRGRPGHRLIYSYGRRADDVLISRITELATDIVLEVPALIGRRADILAAIEHHVVDLGAERDDLVIPPDSAEKLACYGWPGGIGELKRAARRIYKELAEKGEVTRLALPAEIRAVPVSADVERPRWFDEGMFAAVFEEYDGNMKEIAAHFGYARTYLYRVLRQRNIDLAAIRERVEGAG